MKPFQLETTSFVTLRTNSTKVEYVHDFYGFQFLTSSSVGRFWQKRKISNSTKPNTINQSQISSNQFPHQYQAYKHKQQHKHTQTFGLFCRQESIQTQPECELNYGPKEEIFGVKRSTKHWGLRPLTPT